MVDVTAGAKAQKPDRFLIGILAGIGVLLAVAAAAIFFQRQPAPLLPADTPSGVVQRFYNALDEQDYAAAYDLLRSNIHDENTLLEFETRNIDRARYDTSPRRLRINNESIRDERAVISVEVTNYSGSGGLFGGGEYTTNENFTLEREEGEWRISALPYQYAPYEDR